MERLGFSADWHTDKRLGHRVDARGVNLRSLDHAEAARRVCEGFVADAVDVAVIAGDLFDVPRPSERTRQETARRLRWLAERVRLVVLLSGNHDVTGTFTEATAIGTLAMALPANVIVADRGTVRQVELPDAVLTLVPWQATDADLVAALADARPVPGRRNLLVLHCGFADLPAFAEIKPGSQTVTRAMLPEGFDWFVSGHYHGHRILTESRFVFIGSPERASVTEAPDPKGYVLYDPDTDAFTFRPVDTRPWLDLGPFDGRDWDGTRLQTEVARLRDAHPEWPEALVRVRVTGLRPEVEAAYDRAAVEAIGREAFHWDLDLAVADTAFARDDGPENGPLFDDLPTEWARHAALLAGRTSDEIATVTRLGLAALEGAPRPVVAAAA